MARRLVPSSSAWGWPSWYSWGTTPVADTTILTDTPDWSPARRHTVLYSLLTGIALTALGAFGSLWHMSDAIATLVINAGTTLVMSSTAAHIGAASMERVGAWWLNRPVTPHKEA